VHKDLHLLSPFCLSSLISSNYLLFPCEFHPLSRHSLSHLQAFAYAVSSAWSAWSFIPHCNSKLLSKMLLNDYFPKEVFLNYPGKKCSLLVPLVPFPTIQSKFTVHHNSVVWLCPLTNPHPMSWSSILFILPNRDPGTMWVLEKYLLNEWMKYFMTVAFGGSLIEGRHLRKMCLSIGLTPPKPWSWEGELWGRRWIVRPFVICRCFRSCRWVPETDWVHLSHKCHDVISGMQLRLSRAVEELVESHMLAVITGDIRNGQDAGLCGGFPDHTAISCLHLRISRIKHRLNCGFWAALPQQQQVSVKRTVGWAGLCCVCVAFREQRWDRFLVLENVRSVDGLLWSRRGLGS
jgi:hypothetical protein